MRLKFSDVTIDTEKHHNYPGVYMIYSDSGRLLYIGRAKGIGKRLRQHKHFAASGTGALKINEAMIKSRGAYQKWDIELFTIAQANHRFGCNLPSEIAIEKYLIGKFDPPMNIAARVEKRHNRDDGYSHEALVAYRNGNLGRASFLLDIGLSMVRLMKSVRTGRRF